MRGAEMKDGDKVTVGITDIVLGRAPLLVGVENGRVYINRRWEGVYFDEPPEIVKACADAWGPNGPVNHVYLPPELYEMVELKSEPAAIVAAARKWEEEQ